MFADLAALLLTLGYLAQTSDDADGLIHRYLQESIKARRFDGAFRMEFRVEWRYPPEHPEHPNEVSYDDMTNLAAPPRYKTSASIVHSRQSGGTRETHVSVWNGHGEVNKYVVNSWSDPPTASISRGVPGTDVATANRFLESLGLARCSRQKAEAKEGATFWLNDAAPIGLDCRRLETTELIDGVRCSIVERGPHDRLWFAIDNGVPRLLKRDVWRNSPRIRRETYRFFDFRSDGLPERIVSAVRMPVDVAGSDSPLDFEETFTLKHLDFETTPEGEFIVDLTQKGTLVQDLQSSATYVVQRPDSVPFVDQLAKHSSTKIRPRRGDTQLLVCLNLILVGGFVAWLLRRRIAELRKGRAST
jgi:hypothetical protein